MANLKPKSTPSTKPRLLYLDIEWRAVKAYVWRAWDENVMPDQIIEDGGLLCICWKFSDDKQYHFASDWTHSKEEMLLLIRDAILSADAVLTYNGDKYDLPKIQGELLRHNLPPMPPVTSIDLIKTVKKMGFFMNRLAFIGPFLGIGKKVKHEGFSLWKSVDEGDEKARKKMEKYCIQDVKLLVKLYDRVKPFIRTHPHLGFSSPDSCPTCGGTHVQKRGVTRTRSFVTQRLHCQDCSTWYSGTRKSVAKAHELELELEAA